MKSLSYYMSLPWSVRRSEEDGTIILRVQELPGFVVGSESEENLKDEFWTGLECFLESYLQRGELPPVPERVKDREKVTTKKREGKARKLSVEAESVEVSEERSYSESWTPTSEIADPWKVTA